MKSSAFETLIKLNFDLVEQVKSRKRGEKLYMVVKLKDWSTDNHQYIGKIREALRDYFPRIYLTSFGGQTATFRLNNTDFPLD